MKNVFMVLERFKQLCIFASIGFLTACGGGGTSDSSSAMDAGAGDVTVVTEAVISGSVGDGPIVGATLNIYDRSGNLIQTETSDSSSNYQARIKAKGNAYPLTIEATDGVDLVTARAPDFRMTSVILRPSVKQVNVNPFSTLIVETARQMPGGVSEGNIAAARDYVITKLNYGLDPAIVADPVETDITDASVAVIAKASEALGEMIRRSHKVLVTSGDGRSHDDIVFAIASDMIDGQLDGSGASQADRRIAAVAALTGAQVLIETLSNSLRVDGMLAVDSMDNAILATHPSLSRDMLTDSVRVNGELLDQVRIAVDAAHAFAPSIELTTIANTLDTIAVGSLPSVVEQVLPGDSSDDLSGAIASLSNAGEAELGVISEVMAGAATAGNSAPRIAGTPATSVAEDSTYVFQASATDADGDSLAFSIQNRPAWASFNSSTGRLSGTPNNSNVGTYSNVTISVTDGNASDSLAPFTITVTNTPDAPSISGNAPTSVMSGDTYNFQPSASDPDGDQLVFNVVNRPSWANFDSATGRLFGTPTSAQAGVYSNITIGVSDGIFTRNLQAFSITVNAVAVSNTAPTISGTPAANVLEGSAYLFRPSASDRDSDALVFSISNRPSWASFNTSTGQLSGTPGANHVGTYGNILISVSDGSATASLPVFSITVVNTNAAPTIFGDPATSVEEGSVYSFQPVAADVDGDKLTFSIQNRPAWAGFDAGTGRLSGVPGSTDVGSYNNIVISVSDGTETVGLAGFTLNVTAASASTGSMTLSWTAPSLRSDGTALAVAEIAGYTVYYGEAPDSYTNAVNIDGASVTSATITELPTGIYYVAVTARDTEGRESEYSSAILKTVN